MGHALLKWSTKMCGNGIIRQQIIRKTGRAGVWDTHTTLTRTTGKAVAGLARLYHLRATCCLWRVARFV